MNNTIRWLRISYWVGAIADGLMAIEMMFPDILPIRNGLTADFIPDAEYRFGLGWGAACMIAWTVLLIWADRKPMERKDILLFTVCPAISGFVINSLLAIQAEIATLSSMLPTLIILAVLTALFMFSYLKARNAAKPS